MYSSYIKHCCTTTQMIKHQMICNMILMYSEMERTAKYLQSTSRYHPNISLEIIKMIKYFDQSTCSLVKMQNKKTPHLSTKLSSKKKKNASMLTLCTWSKLDRELGSWLRVWYCPRNLSPAAILLN